MQIIVLPEMRGQGVASNLIKFATQDMYQRGFKHLYARIWWSIISHYMRSSVLDGDG